jgi:hypothetical protein
MSHILEDLTADWRRLDARIEDLSSEIKAFSSRPRLRTMASPASARSRSGSSHFGQNLKSGPMLSRLDAAYVFRVAENSTCRLAGAFDFASAVGEQQRHVADRRCRLVEVRPSYHSHGQRYAHPKPRYALLGRSTIRINLPCNGLGHLSVSTLGVESRMWRSARQQQEFTDENHRCNRVIRFCSQDG